MTSSTQCYFNSNDEYVSLQDEAPNSENKPFVGGAEKARRNARKRLYQRQSSSFGSVSSSSGGYHGRSNKRRHVGIRGTRVLIPGQQPYSANGANVTPYPKSMRPSERFFGSLLSSSVESFIQSESKGNVHNELMQQASSLLNVPALPHQQQQQSQQFLSDPSNFKDNSTRRLMERSSSFLSASSISTQTTQSAQSQHMNSSLSSTGTYDNHRSYYLSKAPLILEESRCIISESLIRYSKQYDRSESYDGKRSENGRRNIGSSWSNFSSKKFSSNSSPSSLMLELIGIEERMVKNNQSPNIRKYSPLIMQFRVKNSSNKFNWSNQKRGKDTRSGNPRDNFGTVRWARPGNVVLLKQCQTERSRAKESTTADNNWNHTVLASVVPTRSEEKINRLWEIDGIKKTPASSSGNSTQSILSLMIFRREDLDLADSGSNGSYDVKGADSNQQGAVSTTSQTSSISSIFQVMELTTLISHQRQIEACLRLIKVSFMPKLLGRKNSTHIRFDSSDDEDEVEEEEGGEELVVGNGDDSEDSDDEEVVLEYEEEIDDLSDDGYTSMSDIVKELSPLNPAQEKAALSFLSSSASSLTLVQGPPGTGKSTFLVNVICRRLAAHPGARILVTAPTNKAVTVLAERFLDIVSKKNRSGPYCNAVLIGVEDKLVKTNDVEFSVDSLSSSLQSIYVYTWLEIVQTECMEILDSLKRLQSAKYKGIHPQPGESTDDLLARTSRVQDKLQNYIPSCLMFLEAAKLGKQLEAVAAAEVWEKSFSDTNEDKVDVANSSCNLLEGAIQSAFHLHKSLSDMDSNDVVPELLATAHVIFCTLSTSGASIMKQTRGIDDLLIDEAAAATEPEIWIPFHLRPKRMLAVGDPLQLPPTIISRRAEEMGLSKSMHERLMLECGKEYFMLDHQYRMNPSISSFPSEQFYEGKILNGNNVLSEQYASDIPLLFDKPFSFLNVSGMEHRETSGSYANRQESVAVASLVQKLIDSSLGNKSNLFSPDKIRIITFYQGQVSLVKREFAKRGLNGVMVATVDSSQGCEADVVIISFVRSNSKKGVRNAAGFLADNRRINVALTRARHQLICVGNVDTLGQEGSNVLKGLVRNSKERGCLIESLESV